MSYILSRTSPDLSWRARPPAGRADWDHETWRKARVPWAAATELAEEERRRKLMGEEKRIADCGLRNADSAGRSRVLSLVIEEYASYRSVAQRAGIGGSTLYEIAHGQREPNREQMSRIENALFLLGIPDSQVWQRIGAQMGANAPRTPNPEPLAQEVTMLSESALKHFNLARDPWVNELEDEADLFLDADRKALRARLIAGVQRQHFMALIGPVGAGKTTLLDNVRYWMLRQDRFDVVEVQNVDRVMLTVRDVVEAAVRTLSTESPCGSREARSRQARRLLVECRERDRFPVIWIDEAQNIPTGTLRALKVLYDHKDPKLGYRRLVSIILAGQSDVAVTGENARDLGAKLRSPSLEEVSARVYVLRVPPLADKSIREYVMWKLHRAGSDGIVSDGAFAALARLHVCTPAKIARTMPAVMQEAFGMGDRRIEAEHVNVAVLGKEEK